MKIKEGYILKSVAGSNVVIATGTERFDFKGVITFNDTGAEIFNMLNGTYTVDEIIEKIVKDYEVPYETAKTDVENLIEKMRNQGLIEE
jgi:hypothetical protein